MICKAPEPYLSRFGIVLFPTLDQLRVEALEPDPPFWMIQWVQPRLLRDLGRFYFVTQVTQMFSRVCVTIWRITVWHVRGYLIQERLSNKGEKENSV